MSATTAKYAIPYSTGADSVSSVDNTMQALAERVDLMLGERGTGSLVPTAANTVTSARINYSRTYPTVPVVVIGFTTGGGNSGVMSVWATAPDTSGFTVNVSRTTTTAVSYSWTAAP